MAAKDKRQRNARHHRTAGAASRKLDWSSPAQKAAFEHGLKPPFSIYPQPLLASGGFNATKTTGFILKILYLSELFPGYRTVIARRVAKELRQSTLKSVLQWLPKEAYSYGGRLNLSEGEIVLNNGSEIVLLHLDDPETENVIRGLEINSFLLNQAEEIREEIFDLLMMRLGRWPKVEVPDAVRLPFEAKHGAWPWYSRDNPPRPMPPSFAMLDCNPDHELHWLYRRFHPESMEHDEKKFPDPDDPENGVLVSYKDLGYSMLRFSTLENKFLTKSQKAILLSKDEMYQRRFVRGEWGIPEGQIHDIPKSALIPGTRDVVQRLQTTCRLHRALDYGDTSPTACLWAAVNDDQDVFFFREYYVPNKLVSEHRENIFSLSKMPNGEQERYGMQVADPSIFHPMQAKGVHWSLSQEYSDRKITNAPPIYWSKGDKDEFGTRDRISELMRPIGPRKHPLTGEMGMWPRLFYVTRTSDWPQGIDHLMRETKAQKRVRIGTDGGKPIFSDERDDSIADHLYDCCRYLIAAGISKPKSPMANTRTQPTLNEIFQQRREWHRRGGPKQLARRLKYA